jgi:magnesium-transporting ATPase (P-type)
LLGFCRTVGISFECYTDLSKENLINIVNDDGEKKQYEILGTGQFQFVRPRFSIVCRQGEKASIVCKGTAESMLKIIKFKEDQKAKIENKLAQYKLEGIQPIIYARKTLSNSEIASYMSVRLSLTTTAR